MQVILNPQRMKKMKTMKLLMKEILQKKIKIMNQTLNYQMMNKRKNILKMIRTQKIKQFQSFFSNQKRIMKH